MLCFQVNQKSIIENHQSSIIRGNSLALFTIKLSPLYPLHPFQIIGQVTMAKGKDAQKSVKKKSEKTLKEKREEKKIKKKGKD